MRYLKKEDKMFLDGGKSWAGDNLPLFSRISTNGIFEKGEKPLEFFQNWVATDAKKEVV